MQIKNAVSMIPMVCYQELSMDRKCASHSWEKMDLYFGWQIRLRKSMKSGCSFFAKWRVL